jgi:hypothetical protein
MWLWLVPWMPLKGIEGFKFKDDLRWICPVHPAWCRYIHCMERCERRERLWRHVTMIGKAFKFKDDLRWICPVHLAWCRYIHYMERCEGQERLWRHVTMIGKHFLHLKEICNFSHTSVASAVGPSVTTSSIDFSFQNLVFWNFFEFSAAEIT